MRRVGLPLAVALCTGAAAAAGAAEPAPRSFTLAAGGDVLVHASVWEQAEADAGPGARYDFAPMLAAVRPLVARADLAICHLEVPLGARGAEPAGYPRFSAPPELAEALARTGYDSCSTASNHATDRGAEGVARTLGALDAAGIRHAGTARTPAEQAAPTLLDAGGVRVAHLSYAHFLNVAEPDGQPWLVNELDTDTLLAEARAARAAGAEVVIASLHWGEEYVAEPTAGQVAVARRLMDSGTVDLVLGHHAHVVQPIERFGRGWVAYGLGNALAAASHDFAGGASREGILPEFTFSEGADGRFTVTRVLISPTYVDTRGGLHVADVAADLADPPPGADLARLRLARDRTVRVVYGRGVPVGLVVVR
jgi:poly-gamma-glutamate capsule biosynthesis protein CapA/YwtB (metallophosphatase superfamily)